MLLHSHVCISSSIRHHQLHSNSENATSLCLTHQTNEEDGGNDILLTVVYHLNILFFRRAL